MINSFSYARRVFFFFSVGRKPYAPLFLACLCMIACFTGCDQLEMRDVLAPDQVPPKVRAAPRLVETPPPIAEQAPWPRLGDVPFRPKDFSTKQDDQKDMDELSADRVQGEKIKEEQTGEK